jgi:hypothetical protein
MAQRVYTCEFNGVAVSAVQDLFMLQTTSGMAAELHEIVLGQVTATSVGNLKVSLKRFSGSYTPGSGGSAGTVSKTNFNDSAATCTVGLNETSQTAVNTGAVANVRNDVFNVINGWQYLPAPEDRIQIAPSQALVVSLDTAPGNAETMSGTIVFAELF